MIISDHKFGETPVLGNLEQTKIISSTFELGKKSLRIHQKVLTKFK